jgi:ribosomal protein S18 acetylase RimI-like enzyme
MVIRKAKLKDIELLIPVFLDYEKDSENYLDKKFKALRNKKKPLNKNIKLAFKKNIPKKNSLFLVFEENKQILGYIFGEIRSDKHPLFNIPKTGELNDIAVLKTMRGKGISSMLWKELEMWFLKKRCTFITLSVNINNILAQEIYKKWGFEEFYFRMIKSIKK